MKFGNLGIHRNTDWKDILTIVQYRDQRESWKNLDLDNFSQISSNLGLDNLENCSLGLDLNNFQIDNLGIDILQKIYQIMSPFENIGRS